MATGMSSLPQEVINIIASCLQRRPNESAVRSDEHGRSMLPPYATISRQWQEAIETITFRRVELISPDLPYFERIMFKHRRNILRTLSVEVVLPMYSDMACAKPEDEVDKQANNRAFSSAVKDILGLLRSWHDDRRTEQHINGIFKEGFLTLILQECYSPMDGRHRGLDKYEADQRDQFIGLRQDLFVHRYESSFLRLESPEDIKQVPQIWHFNVMGSGRRIEPSTIASIASRLPGLRSIHWHLEEFEDKNASRRQQVRYDFAKALSTISLIFLESAFIRFWFKAPLHHSKNPPSGILPSPTPIDHLSLALHKLSLTKNITKMTLDQDFAINHLVFWPEEGGRRPFWPQLSEFYVNFNMTTIEGSWFFTRGPEEEEDEEEDTDEDSDSSTVHCFRSIADAALLDPLFAAAAQAATQMPRLQCMELQTDVAVPRSFLFGMCFYAPGRRGYPAPAKSDLEKPRLNWTVGHSGYIPQQSTVDIWKQSKSTHGELISTIWQR